MWNPQRRKLGLLLCDFVFFPYLPCFLNQLLVIIWCHLILINIYPQPSALAGVLHSSTSAVCFSDRVLALLSGCTSWTGQQDQFRSQEGTSTSFAMSLLSSLPRMSFLLTLATEEKPEHFSQLGDTRAGCLFLLSGGGLRDHFNH